MATDKKAVGFLRVSSRRQKDNTSHETQESEMLAYAQENGLEFEKIIRMVESAKDSEKRVQYRQGLQWALRNKVQHILFYVFDRETRNLTDNEHNENLVRSGRIIIHYVRERRIYHKDSPDSDFFLRDVQAVTNKQFVRQLRTKVLDAMRTKAESGWFPGNKPPLGYVHQKMKDEIGRELKRGTIIVPDPIEKNVHQVQREFELRAQGYSAEQIRLEIIREGFIPLSDIAKYHRSAIERRIRNPFYYGEFIWQGERYKGNHELIVAPHILDKVATSLGLRGSYQRKVHGEYGIFGGGWMKCVQCGCHIVYAGKRKKIKMTGELKTFPYYRCTNGKSHHESMRGLSVQELYLWDEFGKAVDSITISESWANEIAKALNEMHSRVREARRREISNYREGLLLLERDEDRVYQDFRRGILDESMYHRQLSRIREERMRFTTLLENANDTLDGAYLETAKSILELATQAKSLWLSRSGQERFDFLNEILLNPQLDGLNVRYDWKKPFGTLKKMRDSADWRPHVYAFGTELMLIA